MEEDIKNIKELLENFIKKYQLKTLKIDTKIEYHSRLNKDNPNRWVAEAYSSVKKIDVNLTK